jgi:hypothetical protein
MKMRHGMTKEHWDDLQYAYVNEEFQTLPHVISHLRFLSGNIQPVQYDCCRSSCCCFVGPYATLAKCPYCNQDRRSPDGKSFKNFAYFPLVPRLIALFKSRKLAEAMQYRSRYFTPEGEAENDKIKDVFDGELYRELLDSTIELFGRSLGRHFFSDGHDIALGLSTDGFAPFKRRKHSAWPLIIFNYNLPPDICFLQENLICVGVIPGPKSVKDIDSFLHPLVDELLELVAGV